MRIATDSTFVQFLLIVAGLTCILVSTSNLPRREETRRLEEELEEKRGKLHELQQDTYQLKRQARAIEDDPYYRRILLDRITGEGFRKRAEAKVDRIKSS